MIRLRAGAASDVGQVRQVNQDSVLVEERLFVVADGMGGHRGGEIASEVAVSTMREVFTVFTADALAEAVQRANTAVVDYATEDPSVKGMGTTVCALAIVEEDGEDRIAIVNVGDSRCYLAKREGGLEQQTEDHSLVATLERQGQLTPEEAASHPHRNILTRALGIDEHVLVDLFEIRPFAGDRYLICSDGLFNEVGEADIDELLRRVDDPTEAAEALVRMANDGGGRDNISVVVVDVLPDDEHPTTGSTEGRLAKVVHAEEPLAEEIAASSARPDPPDDGGAEAPPADVPVAVVGDDDVPPTRFTWRVGVFLLLVLVVVGVAVGAVLYYANTGYEVVLEDGELVVYKGRDALFLSRELDARCGIDEALISEAQLTDLTAGVEVSDDAAVRKLIIRSVSDPEAAAVVASPCVLAPGETPPSTTTSQSSTTVSTTEPTTFPPTTSVPVTGASGETLAPTTTAAPVDPPS